MTIRLYPPEPILSLDSLAAISLYKKKNLNKPMSHGPSIMIMPVFVLCQREWSSSGKTYYFERSILLMQEQQEQSTSFFSFSRWFAASQENIDLWKRHYNIL